MKKFFKVAKTVVFATLAVAMLFSATACKSKERQDGTLADDYVPDISGKIKVTCRADVYPNEESQRAVNNWISYFKNQYKDVSVTVDFSVPESNYDTMISSKSIGDVFWLDDGSVYKYAVTSEALMPLDYYVEEYEVDTSNIYSGIYELGVVEGKLYFAGMSCGQQTFTYNVDALVEAGILQPGERIANDWTWEDFKSYAAQLKVYGEDGTTLVQTAAAIPYYWSPYFSPFFYAYGGQWCDTVNKTVNLYDDKVIQGVQEIITTLENRWVYPVNTKMGDAMTKDYGTVNGVNGVVFKYNTAYTNLASEGKTYDDAGITWDVATFPLFDYAASPCGTIGFGVFSYTSNKDAAAALVLSLYTTDGQMAIHGQEGGDVPILKELGDQDFWHLSNEGWEDINYAAFTANYEKYISSHVKSSVPPEIATIVEEGMVELLDEYCQNSISWKDKLMEIETKCNETWSTLS